MGALERQLEGPVLFIWGQKRGLSKAIIGLVNSTHWGFQGLLFILLVLRTSLYSDILTPGALQTLGTAAPRASQFLEMVKDSPGSTPFIGKPTNLEPRPPPMPLTLLLGSLTLGHCSPALLASGPGTRQPRPGPIPQNPLK